MSRLSPEQVERNERGIAACREVVAAALARRDQPEADEKPLTRSDEILLAARQEAARQHEALNRLTRAHRPKEQHP
ncbi:hypothetical protein [Micromonospora sp. A200]|uniref:hypothetical protein n=1 Tax=Micromonospora sp. A200 TaxID=2940568 RepID=UPI0024736006|nr:hypothetical protein [Micromonospora sp. A200]